MLKYALLGATMAMTVPALAQTTPMTPTPAQTAPTTVAPTAAAPTSTPADPMQQMPATPTDATAPAPETAAAQPAPAEPAKEQVASAVDSQFGTYDSDGNGKLNQAEFGTWMVALKSQADPKTDANSPATKKWNQAAFAQADTDKSKSISKAEIEGFLTPPAAKS